MSTALTLSSNFAVITFLYLAIMLVSIEQSLSSIESLLKTYPEREFILVGDSGEKDPEIYANIARRHGSQIRHIFIRNVSPAVTEENQLYAVFNGLPEGQWTIFRDPNALKQYKIE